jgi:hypothetical protein
MPLMKLLYYSFNLKLNLSEDLCHIYFSTPTFCLSHLCTVSNLPTLFYRGEAYGIIMSMYASLNKFCISWQMLIKHATRMSLGHPTYLIFSFLPLTIRLCWEITYGKFNAVRVCTSQPQQQIEAPVPALEVVVKSCSHNYVLVTCESCNICYRIHTSQWLTLSSALLLNCDIFPITPH